MDGFVKTGAPGALVVEAQAARSGHAQGASSGAFRAPAVLELGPDRLVFERVVGERLDAVLRAHPLALHRLEALGRAVAAVHGRAVPAGARALAPALAAPGEIVWLHGDLAPQNVLIDAEGALVLIDWVPAAWLGEGELGPASIDVAMLVMSLFHRHLLHNFEPAVEAQAEAVLRGYFRAAQPRWRPAALAPVVLALLRRYGAFRLRAVGLDALRVAPGSLRLLAWLPRLSKLEFE